ncbi:hypothetical protein [Celerinatantimonas yamalensis]|uniref:Uncharacterized protein n=1 Tax=Celerinatantimonas yamalensis TaxID=559956 RepID=A0ABW9G4W4_9GAMM
MQNDYGYNLGAASFESVYHARQRIRAEAPVKNLTDYTAERQQASPGTKIFTSDDVPPNQSADQLRQEHNAKVANSKQIREAMDRTVHNSATHIRKYYEMMQEMGDRGQILMARA